MTSHADASGPPDEATRPAIGIGRGLTVAGRLFTTGAMVFALLAQANPAAAIQVDADSDGVDDSLDIDDDGDGVLDSTERDTTFEWMYLNTPSGTQATGTINSVPFTYDSTTTILSSPSMYNVGTFPAQYAVASRNPTIRNDIASTNTITFTAPISNPVLAFSSIGNPMTPVGIQFDRTAEILWSQAVTVNSPTNFTGAEGFAVVRLPGTMSQFQFDYTANETYVNFVFGAQFETDRDSDSDGISDRLDIDSDNDGITDNVEAQPTSGYVAPSGVDSDGNGLDDAYEAAPGSGEGIDVVNTESAGLPDLRDDNSDGDAMNDIAERGDGQPTSITSAADTDGDGLLDIFEHGTANDAITTADHNRTAGTIGLAKDLWLGADGSNAQPLVRDVLFRDATTVTDIDGDGIPDITELGADPNQPANTDGDSDHDYLDTDSDGDGVADSVERGVSVAAVDFGQDADNDGIPDAMDPDATAGADADHDGLLDSFAPVDTDGDGSPDYRDLDSDNDGTPDSSDAHRTVATAGDDTGTAERGVNVTIDVLANDEFPAGANTTVTVLSTGEGTGQHSVNPATGAITYKPAADDPDQVTLTYRVCHTAADPDSCADASITLTVSKSVISGHVFQDLDRDGVLEAGEADLSGVDVLLMAAGPDGTFGTFDDVTVATATTASPYVFAGIADGTYQVRVDTTTLPKGMYYTNDADLGADQTVTVGATGASTGQSNLGQHYLKVTGVFRDGAGNPLANRTVTLTDSAGQVFTVTTGTDGSFAVEGSATNPMVPGAAVITGVDDNGNVVRQNVATVAGTAPAAAVLTAPVATTPTAPTPTTPVALPRTGTNAGATVAWGIGSSALGAAFLLVRAGFGRRRRPAVVPTD
ncbi:MAG: hypothetical protein IT196_21095 [Acidimicrobiales bacterium]|nr:hypothetical protein [Acidimicrobiales bacterium]